MATEQEELKLVVSLVDNASDGIAKLRDGMRQLSSGETRQHTEGMQREFQKVSSVTKALGGEAAGTWRQLGLLRAGLGTAAGGVALFGYELIKGMQTLKNYSDQLRQYSMAANKIGADPAQLKSAIEQLKTYGISAETAMSSIEGLQAAIADLQREGSQLRGELLRHAFSPQAQQEMREFIDNLTHATTVAERLNVIRSAGESVYRAALQENMKSMDEAAAKVEAARRREEFLAKFHYDAAMAQAGIIKGLSAAEQAAHDQRMKDASEYATKVDQLGLAWENFKERLAAPFVAPAGSLIQQLTDILNMKETPSRFEGKGGTMGQELGVDSIGKQQLNATKENTDEIKRLNDALKSPITGGAIPQKMGYSPVGGPFGGMLQNASYTPGGGYNAAGGGGYGGTAPNGQTAGPGTGAGAGSTPPMGAAAAGGAGLAAIRSGQMKELADPAVRDRLMAYTEAEVGSQGPQAKQAFMETILNRAAARGQSVASTLSGSYFPKETHERAAKGVTDAQREAYAETMSTVMGGSNISGYATGNASGSVGFGGGPQTFAAGGEKFGIEKADAAWAAKMRTGEGVTTTGAPDLSSRTLAGYGPHGYEKRKGEPGEFNWAATGALGPPGQNQTTIQLKNGKSVQVNAAVAERYKGFLNELIDRGYPIDSVGGYNYRGKAGGGGISMHSYGAAVDINPGRNAFRGRTTDMPGDVEDMAWKHGLSWGGRFGDPMHFEPMGPAAWANKQKILDARRQIDGTSVATAKVEGTGKLTVDVNAPQGTSVGVEGGGLFKQTEVNRQTQMEPAARGPEAASP